MRALIGWIGHQPSGAAAQSLQVGRVSGGLDIKDLTWTIEPEILFDNLEISCSLIRWVVGTSHRVSCSFHGWTALEFALFSCRISHMTLKARVEQHNLYRYLLKFISFSLWSA